MFDIGLNQKQAMIKKNRASKNYCILSAWFRKQIIVKYPNTKLLKMVQINHDQQQSDKTDGFRSSCF